jgi:hypothetical protein
MAVPKRQSFSFVFSLTTNEAIPNFGLKSFVYLFGAQRLQRHQTPLQKRLSLRATSKQTDTYHTTVWISSVG